MTQLPPDLLTRIQTHCVEVAARLAQLPPLNTKAELARIDALLAERPDPMRLPVSPEATSWDHWMPAVITIGSMVAGAAIFGAGMLVASRMPAGCHAAGSLMPEGLGLFIILLALVASRR